MLYPLSYGRNRMTLVSEERHTPKSHSTLRPARSKPAHRRTHAARASVCLRLPHPSEDFATPLGFLSNGGCVTIEAMQNGFGRELARFGPQRSYGPCSLSWAQAYCGRLARTHYENFTVASFLLPRRLLQPFHAVYAYCRWADDLADEAGGGRKALGLLRWWREELLSCYTGRPRHPVLIALRPVIRAFDIPPQPFLDLLYAFEQDQMLKRYRTFNQLVRYCRHSANPVGHLVLYLFRCYDRERAALADHVCTGLQLANFWQDVARDLDIGRVYLPEEDRRRFGYSDDDLLGRRYTPAFAALLRHEVESARGFFYRGWPLVDRVPVAVRADVELFIRGGLAILRKIEEIDYNVWATRPVLGKWEKAALFVGALWSRVKASLW
ncbi:MAG: squalene synthase HpnC [Gemmataceae bacterium]|nr:squalene synthase HpnC [Gemmataceae bacterium]